MGRKQKYSKDLKIEICKKYISGEKSAKELSNIYDLGRYGNDLVITWVRQYQKNGSLIFEEKQRKLFVDKIINKFGENLTGKTFAVWGLAFKPKTNDMREAPAITIINDLLKRGAKILAYDPKAIEEAKFYFQDRITYAKNSYDALRNCDCMLLLTEWNEFRRPDFDKIKTLLKNPVIFDGRNQYNAERLKEKGFEYYQIGVGK